MELQKVVEDCARGLMAADARSPQCKNYLPGIGPHEEPAVVRLVLAEMQTMDPAAYGSAAKEVPYDKSDAACDLCVGRAPGGRSWAWGLEIKAARALRNNGQAAEENLKQLVSPFPEDRSALTDSTKVLSFEKADRCGLLVYGYDYAQRPLADLLRVLDVLIADRVQVLERVSAPFAGLIHPHHARGQVVGWWLRARQAT
jgi:hypothetical protein